MVLSQSFRVSEPERFYALEIDHGCCTGGLFLVSSSALGKASKFATEPPGQPAPRRVCAGKQIQYVNSGTSGGVWGLAEDYNTMIAGAAHASNITHSRPGDVALQRFQRSVMVAA